MIFFPDSRSLVVRTILCCVLFAVTAHASPDAGRVQREVERLRSVIALESRAVSEDSSRHAAWRGQARERLEALRRESHQEQVRADSLRDVLQAVPVAVSRPSGVSQPGVLLADRLLALRGIWVQETDAASVLPPWDRLVAGTRSGIVAVPDALVQATDLLAARLERASTVEVLPVPARPAGKTLRVGLTGLLHLPDVGTPSVRRRGDTSWAELAVPEASGLVDGVREGRATGWLPLPWIGGVSP